MYRPSDKVKHCMLTIGFQVEHPSVCSCKCGPCPAALPPLWTPPSPSSPPRLPSSHEFYAQPGCFTAFKCPDLPCFIDYGMEPMNTLMKLAKNEGQRSNWTIQYDVQNPYRRYEYIERTNQQDNEAAIVFWFLKRLQFGGEYNFNG